VILGRDDELDQVGLFLGSIPTGPSALVLEGAAGIGKTTLWLEGVAAARQNGYLVLTARAAESEARLSYSALGDLFAEVVDEALPSLPTPQRHALEMALLRTEAHGAPPDQRAVSLASVGVVRTLAAAGPLVVAIDDVQWLDVSSARVLSFVLRRLSDERVGVLVSLRLGSGSKGDPLGIDRALAHVAKLSVGPMPEDPLGRLLRERTGADLPRPVLVRLHRVSNGNPLFALEIARAVVQQGVRPKSGEPLPVPEDLQQLLSARLAALPTSARGPLLAIAATSQPTVDLVLLAAGPDEGSRSGLARAEAAGVVERADGRVRFSHPLLGSTVYVNASPRERRDMHLRLAELIGDPEERARHLALCSDEPDADVARALDEAARHSRARGAPDAAADLTELARQLTPPEDVDALRRRSLKAAEYHFDAGDAARALAVLRDSIASSPPGPDRAEMLYRISSMSWMNLVRGVREPAQRALEEVGEDRQLRSGLHGTLAWVAFYLGDLDEALGHARESVEYATHVADPATRAEALATLGFVEFLLGRQVEPLMSEALELQDVVMSQGSWTEVSVYTTPRSILGLELMWSGRLDEARAVFEQELAEYEEHAMYTVRQEVLCYLAELECRAGRWSLATDYAAEAMETVVESGQTATQSHVALFNQALAAAHLGHVDDARRLATDGVRLALSNDDLFNANWNRAVLGFLELSLLNFELAHAYLEPVVRYLARMGSAEPAIIPCIPDEVEALVALGRVDEAAPLVGRLEEQAMALDRPWALATAARCRGLLAAARGDLEGAHQALEHALHHHERAQQPFELARSLLVLGQIHRRAKKKRLARENLERARGIFVELGAALWIDRAEAELSRIGGRPSSPLELTATELDVAGLVAEGHTNREVADALFMSPGTVQANLKRIFRKLGVRSRTELAARLDQAPTSR
jgi:DNA-binding CsgD family transcriptional regulator